MEDSIKLMIESTIHVPSFVDGEAMTFPGATFQIRKSPAAGLYGDGQSVSAIASIQIDLWYQDKTAWKTAEAALEIAIASSFMAPEISFSGYDTMSHKFRTTFTFDAIAS